MAPSSMRTLMALGAVGLWSTNAGAAGIALTAMSVGWLLLVQYASAATALVAVRGMRRPSRTSERTEPSVSSIVVGVIGLAGTIFLQFLAFATAPIVAANVLTYAWPLLTALWVALTHRTRRAAVLAGFALVGFGGVALIFTNPGSADSGSAADGAVWGYAAAVGSAACMAFYTLASSRMQVAATDLLIPATLAGMVAAGFLIAATDSSWPQPAGWVAAAYTGLGPMAAGYGLWTMAMTAGGAERLGPLAYATPLLSTLLLLATGSPSTADTLVGIALILICSIGVLATQALAWPVTRPG